MDEDVDVLERRLDERSAGRQVLLLEQLGDEVGLLQVVDVLKLAIVADVDDGLLATHCVLARHLHQRAVGGAEPALASLAVAQHRGHRLVEERLHVLRACLPAVVLERRAVRQLHRLWQGVGVSVDASVLDRPDEVVLQGALAAGRLVASATEAADAVDSSAMLVDGLRDHEDVALPGGQALAGQLEAVVVHRVRMRPLGQVYTRVLVEQSEVGLRVEPGLGVDGGVRHLEEVERTVVSAAEHGDELLVHDLLARLAGLLGCVEDVVETLGPSSGLGGHERRVLHMDTGASAARARVLHHCAL